MRGDEIPIWPHTRMAIREVKGWSGWVHPAPTKELVIQTRVRKQDPRGLWFLTTVSAWGELYDGTVDLFETQAFKGVMEQFLTNVHTCLLFGRVDRLLVDQNDYPLWKHDRDQRDEKHRLFRNLFGEDHARMARNQLARDDNRYSAQSILDLYYEHA